VVIAEDGVVVDLYKGRAKIVGAVQAGYVYVDGASVGDVTEASLKDRRILGEEGFISVVVAVDSNTGKILGDPEIHTRGAGIGATAYDDVIDKIQDSLDKAARDGVNDPHQLRQLIRRSTGRWVNDTYRRRPMIIPVLVEV
jgi:ribonuclease J